MTLTDVDLNLNLDLRFRIYLASTPDVDLRINLQWASEYWASEPDLGRRFSDVDLGFTVGVRILVIDLNTGL